MNKKLLIVFSVVLLCSLVVVGIVYAFQMGNVDGVWGEVDEETPIDVIGQIGYDPGSQWGTGYASTADNTIRRKVDICQGDPDGSDAFDPAVEWDGYAIDTFDGLGSHTISCGPAKDLFFSEYIEGSSNNKALEIYNGTGSPIDLAAGLYKIKIYYNGNTSPARTFNLSGTVADGDVFVFAHSSANSVILAQADLTTGYGLFNGNDAVSLVKGAPDSAPGATNNVWATGPAGGMITGYDNPSSTGSLPSIQGTLGGTDWNQVRYGVVPAGAPVTGFGGQTGFGFDGVNDVFEGDGLAVGERFLLGRWCHFNNPIVLADNPLDYVDLDIRIDGVTCPDGGTISEGDDVLTFSYRFYLDETDNLGVGTSCGNKSIGWPYNATLETYECPYTIGGDSRCPWDDTGVNSNGCSDQVTIAPLTAVEREFTCTIEPAPAIDYKIRVVGFVPIDASTACPNTSVAADQYTFISKEANDSCACVYAEVVRATGTAVELNSFTALGTEEGVLLEWETATEVDNLGFNLYRGESLDGERVRINDELIPSNSYPGSPFGAGYEYIDTGADLNTGKLTQNQIYYYWLEDVGIDEGRSLDGPVHATVLPEDEEENWGLIIFLPMIMY